MDEMNILVEEELEEQDIEVNDADEELAIDVEDEETEQDVEVNSLLNKPKINGVTLKGNRSIESLGVTVLKNSDLDELLK